MSRRGFTLLEVMIGLALLGLALTVLIKSTANSIFNAEQAHMMGVVTDLARGQMLEIEEVLIKDGFTDTDQSQSDAKPFADQGWPHIKYSYKVEAVEMPSLDELQQLALGHAEAGSGGSGSGSGSGAGSGSQAGSNGSDSLSSFENSALGGMLSMMGGSSGKGDILGDQGGALIQSQYAMFQQILKVSVRKVTLLITYQVFGRDRDLTLVAFFTDPQAMDKVLSGLGASELSDDTGAGSGKATGAKIPSQGTGQTGTGRSPK